MELLSRPMSMRQHFRQTSRLKLIVHSVPGTYYRGEGIIKNVNTIEEYKNFHGPSIIERAGRTVCVHDPTVAPG